jgi:predicted XRE-type DNA-binding protein
MSSTASKRSSRKPAAPISLSPQADTGISSETELVIDGPYDSVWDAIEDDPAERERLKMRSDLMDVIERHIEQQGWTQKQAAEHFGVTQPRISDLKRGKMSLFSIDALVGMIGAAGLHIEIAVVPAKPIPARDAA